MNHVMVNWAMMGSRSRLQAPSHQALDSTAAELEKRLESKLYLHGFGLTKLFIRMRHHPGSASRCGHVHGLALLLIGTFAVVALTYVDAKSIKWQKV